MNKSKINIVTNKSKLFFTPVFNTVVPIQYFSKLKNTYIWYDTFWDECFCLLYEFDGRLRGNFKSRKGYPVYEDNILFSHDLFDGFEDYHQYVLYKFKLTDEMLEFRDKLIEGRYSKLPEEYKETIINFNIEVYGYEASERIRKILYKDDELLEELAEKYGVRKEIIPEGMSGIDPQKELFINSLIPEREDENEIISRVGSKD